MSNHMWCWTAGAAAGFVAGVLMLRARGALGWATVLALGWAWEGLILGAKAVVPAVRPELTAVEDVAVSALGLLGVPRRDLPGTDLLAGEPPSERALPLGNLLFGEEWTGMRTPLLKYLRSASGEERLYDLASDPDESVNIVASQPAGVAVLRERLADHPSGSHHDMPGRLRGVPSKVTSALLAELTKKERGVTCPK